jgi:phosphate/sulfate permease
MDYIATSLQVRSCDLSDVELLPFVCVATVLALLCAVGIGANDLAANFAMVVGSGSLSLDSAIKYCAGFEVLGAALMGGKVTATIAQGIFDPKLVQAHPPTTVIGMCCASLAATSWLFLSSYFGLPVSITHTAVGSMLGFALFAGGGTASVNTSTVGGIVLSWVLAPVTAAIATMVVLGYLSRLLLKREDFLDRLRVMEARERSEGSDGRYVSIPPSAIRNRRTSKSAHPSQTRAEEEHRRQRSFGGASVEKLYKQLPMLVVATLALNGFYILLTQPAPLRRVPFIAQIFWLAVVIAAAAYTLVTVWLPNVREYALNHRGPFPWQYSALRLTHESATRALPSHRISSTPSQPRLPESRQRQRTRGHFTPLSASAPPTNVQATPSSFPTAGSPGGFPTPLTLEGTVTSFTFPQADAELGGGERPLSMSGEEQRPLSATGASGSEDTESGSEHEPLALARQVSFSAASRNPAMRTVAPSETGLVSPTSGARSRSLGTPGSGPRGPVPPPQNLPVGGDDGSSSDEQQQAASRILGLPDGAGSAPLRQPRRAQPTALVPATPPLRGISPGKRLKRQTPRDTPPTAAARGARSRSPAVRPITVAGESDNVSHRAEYLFTALQLIVGAMSSFVHGAVAGANATASFIVLYHVYVNRVVLAEGGHKHKNLTPSGLTDHLSADYNTTFATVLAMVGLGVGMAVLGARLVLTVGAKLVVVTPVKGYAMQIGSVCVTMLCTALGVPVSLAQCQVGAAVGSGLSDYWDRRRSKQVSAATLDESATAQRDEATADEARRPPVNWGLVAKLVAGWVLTLVVSALTSGLLLHVMVRVACGAR